MEPYEEETREVEEAARIHLMIYRTATIAAILISLPHWWSLTYLLLNELLLTVQLLLLPILLLLLIGTGNGTVDQLKESIVPSVVLLSLRPSYYLFKLFLLTKCRLLIHFSYHYRPCIICILLIRTEVTVR